MASIIASSGMVPEKLLSLEQIGMGRKVAKVNKPTHDVNKNLNI